MRMISIDEAVEMAIEKLPFLQRLAIRARFAIPSNRQKFLDKLMEKLVQDENCCEIAPAFIATAATSGSFGATTMFGIDPDKLERFLQIIIEYLPKILAIVLPLFTKAVLLFVCCLFASSAIAAPPVAEKLQSGQVITESIPSLNISSAIIQGEPAQCKNCQPLRAVVGGTVQTAAALATTTAQKTVGAVAAVSERIIPNESAGIQMAEHARAMTASGGVFHSSAPRENVYWSSDGANRFEARRAWRNSPAHKANLRSVIPIFGIRCRGNACVARGR